MRFKVIARIFFPVFGLISISFLLFNLLRGVLDTETFLLLIVSCIGFLYAVNLFFQFEQINHLKDAQLKEQQAAREKAEREPEKVKPFWDLAQTKLEEYININVKQVQQIYTYSRILMTVGFILIVVGIFLAFSNVNLTTQDSSGEVQNNGAIIIAIVSSASGVLIEFIGASVLVLYRTTVQQSINYVDKLERMNNVGMAMQILDTVSISTADKPVDQQKIFDAKIRIAHQLLNIAQDMTMSSHTVIESSQPPTSAG
jgi:hypothetical protein